MRSYNSFDRAKHSDACSVRCQDKSLALQSQKEEADINTIVRRFGVTGQVPQSVYRPTVEDFVDVTDFRSAMDAMNRAQASFMEMPASVRKRFGNDPAEFVAFCSDPANLDEMRKFGLAVPAPVVDTPPTPVVPPVTG